MSQVVRKEPQRSRTSKQDSYHLRGIWEQNNGSYPHLCTQNDKGWLTSLQKISAMSKQNEMPRDNRHMNTCMASCVLDQVAEGRWSSRTMTLLLTSTKPGRGAMAWSKRMETPKQRSRATGNNLYQLFVLSHLISSHSSLRYHAPQ